VVRSLALRASLCERGRESFSGNNHPHGRLFPRKRLPTWRVQFLRVKAKVLDLAFVLPRTSQRESRVALECGGLTPLSFRVSFGCCTITVGGARRKKGTAKAASSRRTPKKGTGLRGTKIVTFRASKIRRKRGLLNAPAPSPSPHFTSHFRPPRPSFRTVQRGKRMLAKGIGTRESGAVEDRRHRFSPSYLLTGVEVMEHDHC
jgi:hypothetical protein